MPKIWIFRPAVAVLCLISAFAQTTPADTSWAESFEAGQRALQTEDFDAAVRQFNLALSHAERFGESDLRLLNTIGQLLTACQQAEDCEAAKALLDRAMRIRSKAIKSDDASAAVLDDLASAATSQDRDHDAVLLYGEALEIREKLHGPNDTSVAQTYADIAWVYQQQGNANQARNTFDHALSLLKEKGGAAAEGYAGLVERSGQLYLAAGKQPEAQKEFDRAIALYGELWKQSDPRFVKALWKIVRQTEYWQKPQYAESLLKRIVEIERLARPARLDALHDALAALGAFYNRNDRWKEAEGAYREATALPRKRDVKLAWSLDGLARARNSLQDYRGAIDAAERSLVVRKENPGDPQSDVLAGYSLLADLHARNRNYDQAEANYDQLATLARKDHSFRLAFVSEQLGDIYAEHGEYARAAPKLESAVATYELNSLLTKPLRAAKILRLAKVYRAMGRNDDASRMEAMAIQLQTAAIMEEIRSSDRAKYLWIGLGIFALIGLIGVSIAGIAWHFVARRLDRSIDKMFEVPPAPLWAPMAVEPAETEELNVDPPSVEQAPDPVPIPPPPPPEPLPVHSYRFLGDGSTLFEIRLRNLLLSLSTLGAYSFWGKARVRRYLCGQIELHQDRFVFHGTGKELLFGWLKGLPVLAFIIFFPNILPLMWQTQEAVVAGQLAVVGVMMLLWPVARAGAYRYRLNRMSWRGVRFSFRGSTLHFLLLYVRGYLLLPLTLGLYGPFFFVRTERYLLDATFFGDGQFSFHATGRRLLGSYICAVPLSMITFGLFWPWYSALRSRYCWAHTTFGDARFRCTATGGKLLRLWSGNFLLIVATLGFGMSWATARTLRFWSNHLHMVGDPQLASVRQDAFAANAVGESFADFLGFDFGV